MTHQYGPLLTLSALDPWVGISVSDVGRTEQKTWSHTDLLSNPSPASSEVCDLGHTTVALNLRFFICEMGRQAAPTSWGCWGPVSEGMLVMCLVW